MTLLKVATQSRKFGVALAGVLAQVIELGLLHGNALRYAQIASGALAALGVHYVPNKASVPSKAA